jgi:hypothetical protein
MPAGRKTICLTSKQLQQTRRALLSRRSHLLQAREKRCVSLGWCCSNVCKLPRIVQRQQHHALRGKTQA